MKFPKDSLTTNNSPIYISMTSKKNHSKKLIEKISTNTTTKDNDEIKKKENGHYNVTTI